MSSNLIAVLEGVEIRQDSSGRVYWRGGGFDIDADGINGESRDPVNDRKLFAYGPNNSGLDYNANAGYPHRDYESILVCDTRGTPILQEGGGWYSRTAYDRGRGFPDRLRWLDGLQVPFLVVEGFIRRRAKGIVLGCAAKVNGVPCMVGDIGPLNSIGEGSPLLAEMLGIDPNARTGGTDDPDMLFEVFPGKVAVIDGERFDLKPMFV